MTSRALILLLGFLSGAALHAAFESVWWRQSVDATMFSGLFLSLLCFGVGLIIWPLREGE
jgi:hypothetical protein